LNDEDAGDRIPHPIKYSSLNEEEIPHSVIIKEMEIEDFGDRIIRPIEYSAYHEDETEPL